VKAARTIAVLFGAVALALAGTSAANAAPAGNGSCSGGDVASGTYANFVATGRCVVPAYGHVVIRGNLTIAPGAGFDATQWSSSTAAIGGNVTAGPGSIFALGCTGAHPCSDGLPPDEQHGTTAPGADYVGGNVTLNQVYNAAMNGIRIGGNLTSKGGGAGLIPQVDENSPFIPFSVKDDTIRGNVTVTGLRTVWFGVVRSIVGGNMTLTNNAGSDRDANEVVGNTVGGNLSCSGNSPAAQYGDAVPSVPQGPNDYGWNNVRGKRLGECAHMTH
jgi:hypothetical protein